ncbi:lysophospholipase, partial [Vibrio sp. Vb0301]|nr:lysophospholipase [Vibrio sp. Vb0301]
MQLPHRPTKRGYPLHFLTNSSMIHRVYNASSGNRLMATNHSPLTYTQETLFEQAIGGPIAAL